VARQEPQGQGCHATKLPYFDAETIELLRKAHVTVLASVGYQHLEQGMRNHGSGLEQRLNGILSVAEAGIQRSSTSAPTS